MDSIIAATETEASSVDDSRDEIEVDDDDDEEEEYKGTPLLPRTRRRSVVVTSPHLLL